MEREAGVVIEVMLELEVIGGTYFVYEWPGSLLLVYRGTKFSVGIFTF